MTTQEHERALADAIARVRALAGEHERIGTPEDREFANSLRLVVRAAERSGEAPAQPVAWRYRYDPQFQWHYVEDPRHCPAEAESGPLYAAPERAQGTGATGATADLVRRLRRDAETVRSALGEPEHNYIAAADALDRAEAALAEAQRDAERLDWIERGFTSLDMDSNVAGVSEIWGCGKIFRVGATKREYKTLRAAIDAALAKGAG